MLRSTLHTFLFLVIALTVMTTESCRRDQKGKTVSSGVFTKGKTTATAGYGLEAVHRSGELIVGTISSPTTYYEYHGLELGLHFALAQHFASSEGVSVRVVLAADTVELSTLLTNGDIDLAAYPLSADFIKNEGLLAAGYDECLRWAVNANAGDLAVALDKWYTPSLQADVKATEETRVKQSRQVTRHAQAVYLSRDRGVISVYDALFKEAAATTGWDWRLIAAQCYQESAFDPNARSYVGARGLMQLMPATARELGVAETDICVPEANVRGAAKYIVRLTNTFNDIRDPNERIKFVLASYNGGTLHVRDAMALARKYGHNDQHWDEVAPYILGLQEPRYYKDPVVKHGYMVGSETAGYVQNILERWRDYGGSVAITHAPQLPADGAVSTAPVDAAASRPPRKSTKYSSGTRIMTPDDPAFNQMDD